MHNVLATCAKLERSEAEWRRTGLYDEDDYEFLILTA